MTHLIQTGTAHSLPDGDASEYIAHLTARLKEAFYEQLDDHLATTPGGVLLGPIRVSGKPEKDWLFNTGDYIKITVSAVCEDLPIPPEYRLIGGPADGYIIRTQGQRIWYVPVAPPIPTAISYVERNERLPLQQAVYERRGDTAAYFYVRTERQ